jgi:hypothetical protein
MHAAAGEGRMLRRACDVQGKAALKAQQSTMPELSQKRARLSRTK